MSENISAKRSLAVTVLVALAYFAAARASLLLAIPPGYASAVWPAAGVALVATILWGPGVLPGVWAGSFAANLGVDRTGVELSDRLLVAATIGVGAALQAGLSNALIRRLVGPGNPLDRAASVVPMVAIGGPLGCVVNASIATLVLRATDAVPPSDTAFSWLTWWVGDTVGVIIVTPLVLAWVARPGATWRRKRWSVAIPLAITFFGVIALNADASLREETRQRALFDQRAMTFASTLAHEVNVTVARVRGVVGFFTASERVTHEEFAVYARTVLGQANTIARLKWAPVEELGGVEYARIAYVYPEGGREGVIGRDLGEDARTLEALGRARDTHGPAATSPVRIPGEADEGPTVRIVAPVERGGRVEGLVVATIRAIHFVDRALEAFDRTGFSLHVVDVATGEDLYGRAALAPLYATSHPVEAAGRTWRLDVEGVLPSERSWPAWLALVGGLLLVGGLGTLTVELVTRAVQVEALVAARTADLARVNAALHRSNLELQRFAYVASHDLREPLRIVATYAQLLEEESGPALPPEARRRLARVVENARRMQDLVADLLDLSRVEGQVEPFQPADLEVLCLAALDNLEPSVREAGARVNVGALPTVHCDPVQIVSLFENLLGNALKFRRPDVPPEIAVEAHRAGPDWEISVRDNGIGIPPEHHERVFEMFQRLHARDRYPGTGMGLAISRRVVQHHRGRIWIESLGEGTVVRFTLPAGEEAR